MVIIGGTSFVVAGVTPDHLTFCNSPNDTAKNTDFIQKSAPEKLNKKSKFYGTFEPVIKKDMIISGSTSELLISALQGGKTYPHRFVLTHPFNSPHIIALVEVIGGKKTAPWIVDTATNFYNSIDKKAIKTIQRSSRSPCQSFTSSNLARGNLSRCRGCC